MLISVSWFPQERDPAKLIMFRTCNVNSIAAACKDAIYAAWSNIVWCQGRRHGKNFSLADLAVLDIDDGLTIKRAIDRIKSLGLEAGIITTKSHQIEKCGQIRDRFRVILRLAKRIETKREYAFLMQELFNAWPEADKACGDFARVYQPGRDVVAITTGQPVNLPEITEGWNPKPVVPVSDYLARFGAARVVPRWLETQLRKTYPPGQRNREAFKISCLLARMGFHERDIGDILLNSNISLSRSELLRCAQQGFKEVASGGN